MLQKNDADLLETRITEVLKNLQNYLIIYRIITELITELNIYLQNY